MMNPYYFVKQTDNVFVPTFSRKSQTFVITLRNGADYHDISHEMFQNVISDEVLNKTFTLFTLVKISNDILEDVNIKSFVKMLDGDFLKNINHRQYDLSEKNNVIIMIETNESVVDTLAKQFNDNDDFVKYMELMSLIDFYKISNDVTKRKVISILKSFNGYLFWSSESNCYKKYIDITKTNKDLVDNSDGYTDDFEQKETIRRKSHFEVVDSNSIPVTVEHVNNMLQFAGNDTNRLEIICALLVNKNLCHLIVKNCEVNEFVNKMITVNGKMSESTKTEIDKTRLIMEYCYKYAWITMYLEEYCTRTYTADNSRFVLNIDEARSLPRFKLPYAIDEIRHFPYWGNPYNFFYAKGVVNSTKWNYSITSLNNFRRRLDIFIGGRKKKILDGVNWKNMVITGGCMAAIMPFYNPLMLNCVPSNLPKTTPNICQNPLTLRKFFDQYYKNSDVDVLCNHSSVEDYLIHVDSTINIIGKNTDKQPSEIKTTIKASFIFNKETLKSFLEENSFNYDFDEVVKNPKCIKNEVYGIYVAKKNEQRNNINDFITTAKIQRFSGITDVAPIENCSIGIYNSITPFADELGKFCIKQKDGSTIGMMVTESFKFKVSFPLMRTLEFFRSHKSDFMKCISRFHFPPVRSFYNGSTVLMLPSAVISYLTLACVDSVQYTPNNDFFALICKYHMRGYSMCLDYEDSKKLSKYINDHEPLKRHYGSMYSASDKGYLYDDDFYKKPYVETTTSGPVHKRKTKLIPIRIKKSLTQTEKANRFDMLSRGLIGIPESEFHVTKYRSITPFDDWKLSMILHLDDFIIINSD